MDLRSFAPGHYQTPMATARRLEQARSMQEPDCVPVTTGTGGSFYCRLFGVNIRDYYRAAFDNPELRIELRLQGRRWVFGELRDDRTGCGLYLEAFAFDLYGDFAAAKPGAATPWPWAGRPIPGSPPRPWVTCARKAGSYPAPGG